MTPKDNFQFEGTYDARTIPELKYGLLSRAQIGLLAGSAAVSAILCGVCAALKQATFALVFGFLIIVIAVDARWEVRRLCKRNLKRAAETNRVQARYRCAFGDDGVAYENRDTGKSVSIAWANLAMVRETASCVYLVTKAQQMIGLEKKSIPESVRPRLYQYIREKGVKVRRS